MFNDQINEFLKKKSIKTVVLFGVEVGLIFLYENYKIILILIDILTMQRPMYAYYKHP